MAAPQQAILSLECHAVPSFTLLHFSVTIQHDRDLRAGPDSLLKPYYPFVPAFLERYRLHLYNHTIHHDEKKFLVFLSFVLSLFTTLKHTTIEEPGANLRSSTKASFS